MIPAWLANARLGLSAAPDDGKFLDLALSAAACERWIDGTLVRGNPQNEEVAKCALALFISIADCSYFVGPCGAVLGPIRQVTIRLKKLLA